jgi:hypothetical protein
MFAKCSHGGHPIRSPGPGDQRPGVQHIPKSGGTPLKFGASMFFTGLGVERVVFNLDSEPAEKLLPEIDAIGALMAKGNG